MGGLDRGFAAAIGTWSFQLEAPKQNFRGRRLMAQSGNGAMSALSSLSGVKRKLDLRAVRSAYDPKLTSAIQSR
jgi:hypothetical protein